MECAVKCPPALPCMIAKLGIETALAGFETLARVRAAGKGWSALKRLKTLKFKGIKKDKKNLIN